jgi:3-deoxy-7-phosphoheptulonate synthase
LNTPWSPDSWKTKPIAQQPEYEDEQALNAVLDRLAKAPSLVTYGEVKGLRESLAKVCHGEGFLLQGGDCAESFAEFSEQNVLDTLRVLLQMAVMLSFGSAVPVVKIGRLAGQFAKPRSSATEIRDGCTLPSYKGDIINGAQFEKEARRADPERLFQAYVQSVATINLVRAWSRDGLADLRQIHNLTLDFTRRSPNTQKYLSVAKQVEHAIRFMSVCGLADSALGFQETKIYTSHEALLLPYEHAFVRPTPSGRWYNASTHFCWIGDRTRDLSGAHIEMMRGLENPIGLKVGPSLLPDDLVALIHRLNPNNLPGKLTLITRFGHDRIADCLPAMIRAVKLSGLAVVWSCDPMHGNTYSATSGHKTRRFESVAAEVRQFFEIHYASGTHPGGIHLELTGKNVTECVGGAVGVSESTLGDRYHTHCDPRLNCDQSLELAFLVHNMLLGGA